MRVSFNKKATAAPRSRHLPHDGLLPMGGEVGVGEREVVVAEESAVGGEGRGMGRGEDEMALPIDQGALALGMADAQQGQEAFPLRR